MESFAKQELALSAAQKKSFCLDDWRMKVKPFCVHDLKDEASWLLSYSL